MIFTFPSRLVLSTRRMCWKFDSFMMSDICKSEHNHFAGVSLYSPKYKAKAERLLASCARVIRLSTRRSGADRREGAAQVR